MNEKRYKEIQNIAKDEELILPFNLKNMNVKTQLKMTYKYIDEMEIFVLNELDKLDIDIYDFLTFFEYKWLEIIDDDYHKLLRIYYKNEILIHNILPLLHKIDNQI